MRALVSRAYFHVFFGGQSAVVIKWFPDVLCTMEIRKFFPSAVDRLFFPTGEAVGALLRLSPVRRLKFEVDSMKSPAARAMFEAIERMPAPESLDVFVYRASHDQQEGLDGAFPRLPPSLVRFKGFGRDVEQLVGREHQCDEITKEFSTR
ncbi:hypothetical protein M3Y99_00433500 [Aphelenchoides fujianensis]|nr:hypothetical protein M3Y99_00433500 [Aphelenchoides fujianensis]